MERFLKSKGQKGRKLSQDQSPSFCPSSTKKFGLFSKSLLSFLFLLLQLLPCLLFFADLVLKPALLVYFLDLNKKKSPGK